MELEMMRSMFITAEVLIDMFLDNFIDMLVNLIEQWLNMLSDDDFKMRSEKF